jgi:hypothetical protein
MRALLCLALVAAAMAGCHAAPPPLAFEQSARVSLKRICLVPPGVPEHAEVSIMNPIGAGFGVIGSLIETRRAASADAEMADLLSKAHYDFGSALTNAIALATHKAGFAVSRGEEPRPAKERERFLSLYPKRLPVDAYLDVYATYVGFRAPRSSAAYRPRIELVARLVNTRGTTVFQRRIVYGSAVSEDEDALVVAADDSVTFRDRAALQANPSRTARALQMAIDSISWELARQLM